MSLIRRANISDKALDLSNFNRMVDYVNMLAGMTVDQNMTISKGPPVFMLGIRSFGDTFPWAKVAFGYRLNYCPSSGALIIVPNPTGYPWVTINSGAVDKSWPPVTDTQYLEPYLRRAKAFVLRNGETVIFIRMEGLTPFICSGPAVWDVTNTYFTVESYYGDVVDGTDSSVTALTDAEKLSLKILYKFTVESLVVNESLTVVSRFLDIEGEIDEDELPIGTADNPHLVWDATAAEWVIGEIVPDGAADTPHLVWNVTEGIWEADEIVPDGTDDNQHLVWDEGKWIAKRILPDGGDEPCVAIWVPLEDAWTALSMGTDKFKFLQLDDAGNVVMDYGRMTNI